MIRVVGIITTVFAALELSDILSVFGFYSGSANLFEGIFSVVAMVLILGMGITGIVCARNKSVANIILIFGIAILVLMITIELIGAGNGALIMFIPSGVLYIVGAVRRKTAPY